MPSNFANFSVTWFDESDGYVTSQDITDDVIDLPLFTDTGSGEVNEAKIVVKAPNGRRITSASPASVEKYDRIRIVCDDLAGNTYDRYFEIDDFIPSQSKDEGTLLTLNCLGIEYHLQSIHFAKPFWYSNAFDVAKEVGNTYNANRGFRQPILSGHDVIYNTTTQFGNGLPKFTINHYEYGVTPLYCYQVLMDLINRQAGPAGGGGIKDFLDLGFDTFGVNGINIRIFSSGQDPEAGGGTPITIEKAFPVNPSEGEGIVENPSATQSWVLGDTKSGSLPVGRSKYNSGIFQFVYRPRWIPGTSYRQDSKVVTDEIDVAGQGGRHWKSDADNNTSIPGTADWTRIDMGDEFGDNIQYSEWTDDKVALWVNAGANPSAVTPIADGYVSTGASCFDGNIVIDDNGFFRTWVDERTVGVGGTPSVSVSGEYEYANGIWPRGYRMLVDGTGIFVNGTRDRNNVIIEDCIVERVNVRGTGPPGTEWVVKYKLDSTNDRMQIAVLNEAKVYEWNNSAGLITDISASDLGNDCFHKWDTMKNVDGFDPRPYETDSAKFPDITKSGGTFATNQKSAIEVVYDFNTAFIDRITNRIAYLSHGAWINFRYPFPVNTYNSISENVGDIYGGGTESVATAINEPATLDISNLGYTPTGKLGFNNPDSDSLLPLESLGFVLGCKIEVRTPILGTLSVLDGRATFKVLIGDTNDNVWHHDIEIIETNGNGHAFDIPYSSFEIYPSYRPRYVRLNGIADLINPKDLDQQNILEERNVKWIVIQHQNQYDEFNRFAPEGNLNDLSNTSLTSAFGGKITLTLDDFHHKKQLFVTSGNDATRNMEADFVQRQDITLYDQAVDVANVLNDIEQFQHKEFDVTETGNSIFDKRFGDSVYFRNASLVSDSDNGSNSMKGVVKRNEYSITKNPAGRGGLQARRKIVKRFE
ncbi:hypothetical protein K0U27_00750 [archaeon]|nr:hypothetical protein [archaeon]